MTTINPSFIEFHLNKSNPDKNISAEKAFTNLISLYDVCDELEANGDDVLAKQTRKTLNILRDFISNHI